MLQSLQNQGLRVATGCLLMTSKEHLHQECKMIPLYYLIYYYYYYPYLSLFILIYPYLPYFIPSHLNHKIYVIELISGIFNSKVTRKTTKYKLGQ